MLEEIIEFDSDIARVYFKNSKVFCDLELPKYFDFKPILDECFSLLENKELTDLTKISKVKKSENVSYEIYVPKDSSMSWRKMEILNPVVYAALAQLLTANENWDIITSTIKKHRNESVVESHSIPLCTHEGKAARSLDNALNWWENIEQQSLQKSLSYRLVIQADIKDFYPSVYTHTIEWALHGKEESKRSENNNKLGSKIDSLLMCLNNGQTNGVPQGSELIHLITEVLLAYADSCLTKKTRDELQKKGLAEFSEYRILRYRDDYRILCNQQSVGEIILQCLSQTLLEINLKLNSNKTKFIDNATSGSFKSEKLSFVKLNYDQLFRSHQANHSKDVYSELIPTNQYNRSINFPVNPRNHSHTLG